MPKISPYSLEFRSEAVRLLRSSGRSVRQVAHELGVSPQSLSNWSVQLDVDEGKADASNGARKSRQRDQRSSPGGAHEKLRKARSPRASSLVVPLEAATDFAASTLVAAGAAPDEARRVAAALVAAEQMGYAGHGLARIPGYVARIAAGGLRSGPWRLVHANGPVEHYDGRAGFGHLHLYDAIERSAQLAKEHGVGVAGVSNSNHAGALGVPTRRLAELGLIGIAATNAPAVLAPPGGSVAITGTNPLAVVAPIPGRPPLVCDLSSSQITRGQLLLALTANEPIPLGWALDADGLATTDPRAALGGTLVPLGGHKGFALSLAVEILTGMLLGPVVGPDLEDFFGPDPSRPQRIAHFVLALDPNRFGDQGSFVTRAARLRDAVEHAGQASETRLPGSRSAAEAARSRDSLHLTPELAQTLFGLAKELRVTPLPRSS